MRKFITILILSLCIGCTPQHAYYVPDSQIKGDDTEAKYTIKVTEKGLRRLKLAVEAYKKGVEYSKTPETWQVVLFCVGSAFIGGMAGYYGGK